MLKMIRNAHKLHTHIHTHTHTHKLLQQIKFSVTQDTSLAHIFCEVKAFGPDPWESLDCKMTVAGNKIYLDTLHKRAIPSQETFQRQQCGAITQKGRRARGLPRRREWGEGSSVSMWCLSSTVGILLVREL